MLSILQPWVMSLPIRYQGAILTAIRGCDGHVKEDASKVIIHGIRNTTLVPANSESTMPGGFMPFELEDLLPAMRELSNNCDEYPLHFIVHLYQGLEAIAYTHPDKALALVFEEAYKMLVIAINLNVETREECHLRLSN